MYKRIYNGCYLLLSFIISEIKYVLCWSFFWIFELRSDLLRMLFDGVEDDDVCVIRRWLMLVFVFVLIIGGWFVFVVVFMFKG